MMVCSTPAEWAAMMTSVLTDAEERMGFDLCNAEIYAWTQVWGNTACGFGGIAGQAMTTAPTVVVWGRNLGLDPIVYHAGRFAYIVRKPNEKFYEALQNHQLPGAVGPRMFMSDLAAEVDKEG